MTRRFVCRAESPLFTAWRNTTYCAELLSGNERLSIDVSLHGTLHHVCSYHWVEEKTRWSMTVIDIFKAQICQICWHKAALEGLKYNIGNYTILFNSNHSIRSTKMAFCVLYAQARSLMWKWRRVNRTRRKMSARYRGLDVACWPE